MTAEIAEWLREYREAVLRVTGTRSEDLTEGSVARALAFLPLLAARELTTFSASDNASWVKAGGLVRPTDPKVALKRIATAWAGYLETTYTGNVRGTLTAACQDARTLKADEEYEGVLFSPPYANRLDYLRMLAPEAVILQLVGGVDVRSVERHVVGTNIVRGSVPDKIAIGRLPRSVREALRTIRSDAAKASATYYYPFFANYSVGLFNAVGNVARALAKSGKGIAFVRDTPRKDVLFPTADTVIGALRAAGCRVQARPTVVRHHIGMRRKRGHVSLQGLAQREWRISFERI
ncbi:MAG: hypothetical protein HYS14_08650 [Candidatus Rokubacteria bacterium]|nr:hypothetical protein [Candidatus Rokubacteria bacterium]